MTDGSKVRKYYYAAIGEKRNLYRSPKSGTTLQYKIDRRLVVKLKKDPQTRLDAIRAEMDATRKELNQLVLLGHNHINEEVLALSRKLDVLVYQYTTIALALKTKTP